MKLSNTFFIKATLLFIGLVVSCADSKTDEPNKEKIDNDIFVEVTEGRIALDGGVSRGVAWGDYDADGDPDLYVANSSGQWNAIYRNNGDGTFKKMTEGGGDIGAISETVKHGGNSEGVNWVDYDNDGDLDLYVVSRGEEGNFLFENLDNSSFKRITDSPLTAEGISASMACWADIEGDGDLDVVVVASGSGSNLAFKNLGNGKFEKLDGHILSSGNGRGRACACGDSNNDGLPEFYIANARTGNEYYANLGDWNFESVNEGHMVEDIGYSYGVSWADYDGDGDLDLFLANFDKRNFLYQNDGQGVFTTLTKSILTTETGGASKGHSWGDYDNDGDLDLFIANGTYRPKMNNFLYLNQGKGDFVKDYSEIIVKHADTSAGMAHADFDRDGDLDIFVANWGSSDQINRFYKNTTSGKHWMSLRLTGKDANKYGIGSRVTLFYDMHSQTRWMYPVTGYGSQDDYELHFGFGAVSKIDSLQLVWPNGQTDVHKSIEINKHYLAVEGGNLEVIN
ncbi:CRTAC1 family protein [uncultured Allomuricauda sp.]|uniref:CRTAC1 family protein n=1 Tax=Flagellimonas sp. W118 TaxID=3410791 RepID=UPI002628395F|nr:CRTAC1 family protein [uncultured Allomuricauda sp.]